MFYLMCSEALASAMAASGWSAITSSRKGDKEHDLLCGCSFSASLVTHIQTYIHTYIYLYICSYIYTYVCINFYIYICTYPDGRCLNLRVGEMRHERACSRRHDGSACGNCRVEPLKAQKSKSEKLVI